MGRHKRRQFFINREFQGRYIFSAFISVVVGSVLFALIFSFFSSNTLSIVYEGYHLRLGTTPGLLLDKIFSAQWLFVVLGGIVIAVVALFLSHRVAGPLYRFEKTLEKMTAKDLSDRIRLRKHDEGKNIGEKIDRFNEMISQSLERIRMDAEAVQQCCDAMEALEELSAPGALPAGELKKIRQHNQSTLDLLSEFRL